MKIIKNNLGKSLLLFCLVMFSFLGNAQVAGTHFTVSLANVTSTSNTMEFDVMLTVDGTGAAASGVKMSAMSVGINYNTTVVNGGTLTLSYVAGTKSTAIAPLINNTLNAVTPGHLRIGATALTIDNAFDVVNGTYTFGRYRVTNTANWVQNSNAQLWLQPNNTGGKTNTVVNAFPYGATTGALSYSYNSTSPSASPGVSLVYTQASTLSHALNTNCGITSQPVNPTICKAVGGTASVSVTAIGTSGATYQWETQTPTGTTWAAIANNSNYSGANTATLNITRTTAAVPAVGTKYRVIINGGVCNNVTSDTVVLQEQTVLSKAAAITAKSSTNATLSPANTTCQGSSVNLTLAAGSIGNIQWQSSTDGINYSNVGDVIAQSTLSALNPALTFSTSVLTQDTWFRVVASNGICSSVNGTALKITVSSPAVAGTITGGDVTVCAYLASGTPMDTTGNFITLPYTNSTTMTINGNNGTVLWQKSINYNTATPVWSSVTTGIVGNQLTVANLTADTWYRAIISNGACKATTAVTKITVNKAAKAGAITSTINNVVTSSVCTGGDITFTSAAYTGTSIQWEVSTTSATEGFTVVSGQNGLVFTMNNVAYPPLSKFYVRNVVYSGSCTMARSAVKTITVNPLSVAGTVTGGGTVCANSGGTVKVAGNVGKIQWEYSTDGVNYLLAPYWKTVAFVSTYFNPSNTTEFNTTTSTGVAATYVFTNLTSNVYFRAKITSGACSSVYTNAVQYVIGSAAVAGTASATNTTICPATSTTLNLTGAVGTITWQKSTNWATALPTWTPISNSNLNSISTGNLTVSTAFRASVTIGSCSTEISNFVVVNVVAKPVAKSITASVTSPSGGATTPLCTSNASKVLTIGAGYLGNIQWQTSTTSSTLGFSDIAGQTGSSYTIANPVVGVNYYRASFTNSCGVVVYSAAVAVYYQDCTTKSVENATERAPFAVIAYPNPYSENFNLSLTTTSEANVSVMVYDMTGRLVEQQEVRADKMAELQVGNNYPTGIYNVIITQGSEVKTLRVVKR
ncbi:T9SS type A sorting domain-containing protein [Flavobacterium sp. J49]|uniref:T9SS type A sorting domain-containing protein n=1 Tax=Flavobacterium sp. J49 TaxID=2718534 RepID=UPI0015940ED0|nr:T9SS type A sorting domain-containing protein [Flavobacterium sp. J49]MBF6640306.1 T9SS type A sorting domain-containing protein [Flavobacterium sp. J49]NIC01551.1 T9SS type A sorting domain-containing protein [Flavobacterium sp. J49]